MNKLIDIAVHLDTHLNEWSASMGPWVYVLIFGVVFCETGLVVTPFLPGDSLLFALGALTSTADAALSYPVLFIGLMLAAFAGDLVNYNIGRKFGEALFTKEDSKIFNREHLLRTQKFYQKHGAKTVVMARFIPIVRTFAPFVAGIGKMKFPRFISFSIAGSFLWVSLFLTAGKIFGNIPAVKKNFEIAVLAFFILPGIPVLLEIWKARRLRATSNGD